MLKVHPDSSPTDSNDVSWRFQSSKSGSELLVIATALAAWMLRKATTRDGSR